MALGQTPVSTTPASTQASLSGAIDTQGLVSWLKDDKAFRCIIMEVNVLSNGVETVRYLSNKGYVTGDGDIPANTVYVPLIAGGVQFTESISLDGSASLSFGDIELYNTSGDKDDWLDDIWAGRAVKMFIGDATWPRAYFQPIFDGIVAGIDTRRRDRINIRLSDKLQRLNTTVTDQMLGGTTTNADKLVPLLFGECFNVEPLLADPAYHEYQVHNGPIEGIIEVRDNGVPVEFTPFLDIGKFRLNQQPSGTITCSVQGDKSGSYYNDVTSIIKRIVTAFGQVDQRLSVFDLDIDNLSLFQAENPQPVGIYLRDKANVLDVCNQLASSVGARLIMSRVGLLRLVKLDLDGLHAGTVVTPSDVVEKSLYVASMPPVKAGVKLGYCKNWTVQTSLQTGLPDEDLALFATEWMSATVSDSDTSSKYKLFTSPDLTESLLLTQVDAQAEATRRLDVFKVQRKVLHYTGRPQLLLEQLGNSQTIKNQRFGLEDGTIGQIITVVTDWIECKVELEVLI